MDAYTAGFLHGSRYRASVLNLLRQFGLGRFVNRDDTGPNEQLIEYVAACERIIESDVPLIAEELQGLAAGADIHYRDAVALHYWRELSGPAKCHFGECSALASLSFGGQPMLAQNIDLPLALQGTGYELKCDMQSDHVPRALMYTFGGLLGFVGLNSGGLAVGINFVAANDWQPGVSPYLLVRHLLQFDSVEFCIRELRRIRRSSSRALLLCDVQQLAVVEMTGVTERVLNQSPLFHTNHYLHPELTAKDSMNIFSRNTSVLRLNVLQKRFSIAEREGTVDAVFELLSDHSLYPLGVCVHGNPGEVREGTVASVVLRPAERALYVRDGPPCEYPTRVLKLT